MLSMLAMAIPDNVYTILRTTEMSEQVNWKVWSAISATAGLLV